MMGKLTPGWCWSRKGRILGKVLNQQADKRITDIPYIVGKEKK
jgi:hypothetical protein